MGSSRFVRCTLVWFAVVALLGTSAAVAGGPGWMPGFPMRMGPNVMLMWAPVPGATGYNVYRSTKKGELGAKVTTSPMNNYMDPNVPTDKDAVYTIKAVLAGGAESEPGTPGVLAGIKPLEAPRFSGDLWTGTQLNIRWDQVPGAAFYNVYRKDKKGGAFNLIGSVQEPKYVDATVKPGETHSYQVSAVDKNNVESPRSEVLEVAIKKAKKVAKAVAYKLVEKITPFVGYWYGSDEVALKGPADMVVDEAGGRVYVACSGGLIALDLQGNPVKIFLKPADYVANWGIPLAIALDDQGDVWSTWLPGGQVRHFTPDGTLAGEWTLAKPEDDYKALDRMDDWARDQALQSNPYGIAVDPQGRVWTADNSFWQVSVSEPDGTLVKRFLEPRPRGHGPQAFKPLSFLRFHRWTDRTYLMDPTQKTIRAFTLDMEFVKGEDGKPNPGWKRGGSTTGYVQLPKGFGFTPDGDLAIVDGSTFRIQVFDPDLKYKATLVSKAGEKFSPELGSPLSVAFTRDRMLVSDKLSNRIAVFTYNP